MKKNQQQGKQLPTRKIFQGTRYRLFSYSSRCFGGKKSLTFKKSQNSPTQKLQHPSLTGRSSPPKVSQMSKGDLQADSRFPSIRSCHTLQQLHPNQRRTKLRNLQGSVQKENARPHVQKLLRMSRL